MHEDFEKRFYYSIGGLWLSVTHIAARRNKKQLLL